jgi:hypothetical protein
LKDEGDNLSTFAQTFNCVVKCVPLALATPWQGSYSSHVFNKACQNDYNDVNVCVGFQKFSLNATQCAL